jgi:hypothetical protein
MTENPAFPTTLTGQLRCLIDAVRESCGLRGPRGLFALPVALWMWVRSRRMRREIEAAARQFVALAETLVALLEDFRAGRLPPLPPPRREAGQRAGGVGGAGAPPLPRRRHGERRERQRLPPPRALRVRRALRVLRALRVRRMHLIHPHRAAIVAGKNGNPSRAPPSSRSGEGQPLPGFFKNRIFGGRDGAGNSFQHENDLLRLEN